MDEIFAALKIIAVLKIIGICLLGFAGIILLNVIAFIQITWNMSDEEKEELVEYIKKNGILGNDDDFL